MKIRYAYAVVAFHALLFHGTVGRTADLAANTSPTLTRPPAVIHFVEAPYPETLASQGLAGEAVLWVDIDARGEVQRVTLQRTTHPDFGDAALTAATWLQFSPALVDNLPAAMRLEYRYRFEPQVARVVGADPNQVLVHGLVREAGTRLIVAGAAVFVDGKAVTSTDPNGEFDLQAPLPEAFSVQIRKANFEAYEVQEKRGANEQLRAKYYLVRTVTSPFQTVVRSREEVHEVSKIELSRQELEHVPGTFGDPVRVIENLPGMGSRRPWAASSLCAGPTRRTPRYWWMACPSPSCITSTGSPQCSTRNF